MCDMMPILLRAGAGTHPPQHCLDLSTIISLAARWQDASHPTPPLSLNGRLRRELEALMEHR
jgi:hypothetical protein